MYITYYYYEFSFCTLDCTQLRLRARFGPVDRMPEEVYHESLETCTLDVNVQQYIHVLSA